MALITNKRNAASYARGTIVGGAEAWGARRISALVNLYASEGGIDDKSGVPSGYNIGAILLPLKPGGMSVFKRAAKLTQTNADAKMGRPITASSTMSLSVVNAQADQIISMSAAGTLSLTSNADISAGVQAEASGTCAMTGDCTLGGIIPISASGSCAMTPSLVVSALANMEASAGGPTPLSPEGLARAVWSETSSAYTTAGTFGKKVNDLSGGGGGGPSAADIADAVWDEAINSHLTAGSAGKFIDDLRVELDKRLKTSVYLGSR
jgi:hypothetical protein